MKTKVCVAMVIGCLAAVSHVSAQFCEVERAHIRFQGDGMSADFLSVDTSRCALGIETAVHVEGSVSLTTIEDVCGRGAGHTSSEEEIPANDVAIFVGVYDRCLATQVRAVTGIGHAEDIHLGPNFKTASLRAAFEGIDDLDKPVSIAIDLVWTSAGKKERTVTTKRSATGSTGTCKPCPGRFATPSPAEA